MADQVIGPTLGPSAVLEWTSILGLVFGGCCWNVFALEAVLKEFPKAGIFLTFAQFTYVTLQTASSQLVLEQRKGTSWIPHIRLRPRKVPLQRWAVQVVLFLGVSLMNNFAFSLKVPVPVHIIFRSGGLCVSMAVGYLYGNKKYTGLQVSSVFLVTAGILLATLSAPPKPKAPIAPQSASASSATHNLEWPDELQYAAGIALLSGALLISAAMGLWQEGTYRRYGAVWQEGLFYSHALSLPFFLPFTQSLGAGVSAMSASPPIRIGLPSAILQPLKYPTSVPGNQALGPAIEVPRAWIALGVNVVTQGLCVRGVNRLTARVSAVSVNLILTVRKAVSLLISVMYYGSGYNLGLAIGAGMVLLGTMLYSTSPPASDAGGTKKVDDRTEEKASNGSTGVSKQVVSPGSSLRKRI